MWEYERIDRNRLCDGLVKMQKLKDKTWIKGRKLGSWVSWVVGSIDEEFFRDVTVE